MVLEDHRLTVYGTRDMWHKLTVYATGDTCHRKPTVYATQTTDLLHVHGIVRDFFVRV